MACGAQGKPGRKLHWVIIVGAGVLPSGNDTRGVILGDVVGAFVVGLPLAVLLGLYTPLGVTGIFIARVVTTQHDEHGKKLTSICSRTEIVC